MYRRLVRNHWEAGRWETAAFVLLSKFSTCFSAATYQKAPESLSLGVFNSFLSLILLLGVVVILAFAVIISPPTPRTGRKQRRATFADQVATAEKLFDPGQLDSLRLRPYEKAFHKMRESGIMASDIVAFSALETEFNLDPHTLLIYFNWKRKQPAALPPEQTDAERKAAKKARQEKADQIAQKEQQEQLDQEQQLAAAAIAHEYKINRDKMMLHAARACVLDLHGGESGENRASITDIDGASIRASVARVLSRTDQYGNKFYHTIQPRTLFKHAQELCLNSNYQPKTKGGAPSVLNSPWSEEYITFLKEEYAKTNRTAQNCKKMEDLNQFIIDRYKIMFFKNQEASAPEMSKHTLRKLRKLMKVKAGAAKYVSARRWEAMGDPRYCKAAMQSVLALTSDAETTCPGTSQLPSL
jgi:hypothetical protein